MADEETPETPEQADSEAPQDADATQQPEAQETQETPEQAPAPAEAASPSETPEPAEEASEPAEETPSPEPVAETPAEPQAQDAEPPPAAAEDDNEPEAEAEATPREKPAVPGAHLEVDIVPEGADPLGSGQEEYEDRYASDEDEPEAQAGGDEDEQEALTEPISTAAIDLASGARYRATGKRKTAIARVILRPGSGTYLVNGRALEDHFPRITLQRNIRQPLETVGYQDRMDVVARLHGGGISAQAGALRHGVSRALLEADPNLRGELKRRGFLTRDSRAKERKKAGLKKARKRPQFSKR
jgi:small subunit ribosomal protein S9